MCFQAFSRELAAFALLFFVVSVVFVGACARVRTFCVSDRFSYSCRRLSLTRISSLVPLTSEWFYLTPVTKLTVFENQV